MYKLQRALFQIFGFSYNTIFKLFIDTFALDCHYLKYNYRIYGIVCFTINIDKYNFRSSHTKVIPNLGLELDMKA